MFQLNWWDLTFRRLADIYVVAAPEERARMADGVERLNAALRSDPADVGESRPAGFRIAFSPLLVVVFHVSVAQRTVHVTGVKRYGR